MAAKYKSEIQYTINDARAYLKVSPDGAAEFNTAEGAQFSTNGGGGSLTFGPKGIVLEPTVFEFELLNGKGLALTVHLTWKDQKKGNSCKTPTDEIGMTGTVTSVLG